MSCRLWPRAQSVRWAYREPGGRGARRREEADADSAPAGSGGGCARERTVLGGTPDEGILRAARLHKADLIVVGNARTHGPLRSSPRKRRGAGRRETAPSVMAVGRRRRCSPLRAACKTARGSNLDAAVRGSRERDRAVAARNAAARSSLLDLASCGTADRRSSQSSSRYSCRNVVLGDWRVRRPACGAGAFSTPLTIPASNAWPSSRSSSTLSGIRELLRESPSVSPD